MLTLRDHWWLLLPCRNKQGGAGNWSLGVLIGSQRDEMAKGMKVTWSASQSLYAQGQLFQGQCWNHSAQQPRLTCPALLDWRPSRLHEVAKTTLVSQLGNCTQNLGWGILFNHGCGVVFNLSLHPHPPSISLYSTPRQNSVCFLCVNILRTLTFFLKKKCCFSLEALH